MVYVLITEYQVYLMLSIYMHHLYAHLHLDILSPNDSYGCCSELTANDYRNMVHFPDCIIGRFRPLSLCVTECLDVARSDLLIAIPCRAYCKP